MLYDTISLFFSSYFYFQGRNSKLNVVEGKNHPAHPQHQFLFKQKKKKSLKHSRIHDCKFFFSFPFPSDRVFLDEYEFEPIEFHI